MKETLSPSKAILQECRSCMNTGAFRGCASNACFLNRAGLSHLKRIKAHCLTCVPEQTPNGVKACAGKIKGPEPHTCPLYLYRMGHNPNLRGKRGKGNPEALKKWRERKESQAKFEA